jgi:hypothetical protein
VGDRELTNALRFITCRVGASKQPNFGLWEPLACVLLLEYEGMLGGWREREREREGEKEKEKERQRDRERRPRRDEDIHARSLPLWRNFHSLKSQKATVELVGALESVISKIRVF